MIIALAADHGGFKLKELIKKHLKKNGMEVRDYGAYSLEKSDDYPDFAFPAAASVGKGENNRAILVCSTGIGMSIAANKTQNVRAALVMTPELARMARTHNNANVITLPGNGQISNEVALKIVDVYLETEFKGGRHQRRVEKIESREIGLNENPDSN